ncbi:MAG TPA: hypothetical protein VMB80_04140 [Candidatus Acidoferrum sp.]|nr:hypothetical protein [Candidatus Acidoferrum sp.]
MGMEQSQSESRDVNVLFLGQLPDQKRLGAKPFCSFGDGRFRIVKNADQFAALDQDEFAKISFGPVRLVFSEELQFLFECHIHSYFTPGQNSVNHHHFMPMSGWNETLGQNHFARPKTSGFARKTGVLAKNEGF